jgi:hypothetical protein
VFRCSVRRIFIPCGRTCSTTWICVPSAGCWHCSALCYILFLCTVLWPLRGLLGNCSGVLSLLVTCVGVSTALYRCCPLLRRLSHYCFEFRIALYGNSDVYLVSIFGLSVNVKFLKGVKHFLLSFKLNYVRYFVHWTKRVSLVNDILCECTSIVCVFKVIIMFAVPHTAGLPCEVPRTL